MSLLLCYSRPNEQFTPSPLTLISVIALTRERNREAERQTERQTEKGRQGGREEETEKAREKGGGEGDTGRRKTYM